MTIAVITLAAAVLALGAGFMASMAWGRKALDAKLSAQEDRLSTERKCLDLEDDRDAERARASKAEAGAMEAKKAAGMYEAAAKAAREELIKHVREKLATGSDDDVAAEVDRLLGVLPKAKADPVPDVPSSTTGDDHRPA